MNKESRNGFDTGYVVGYHMVQFPADFRQLCGKGRFPQILVDYSIFYFFYSCGKKARCRLEITLQRKVSLFTCFICITTDCRWEVEMLRFEAPSESVKVNVLVRPKLCPKPLLGESCTQGSRQKLIELVWTKAC